jgi:hypothetical protein
MEKSAEEVWKAAQAEATKTTLEMQKKMLELQEAMTNQMAQQKLDFEKFQKEQLAAAAAAALVGAGAGGVGERAGGVGGSGGGSEAGSSETGGGRQKKKAKVTGAGGKGAADGEDGKEDAEEEKEEKRLPCEVPGCKETFKICITTKATISNHMRNKHPQCKAHCACVCCSHCVWWVWADV